MTRALDFHSESDTVLDVVCPPGLAGSASLIVTNPDGSTSGVYMYLPGPAVASVSPAGGSTEGGDLVQIFGTGFVPPASVTFGGNPATAVTVVSASEVDAKSPAIPAAGPVDVIVTTSVGSSPAVTADQFTYVDPPVILSVVPSSGSAAGGDSVTITGSGFTGTTQVLFGLTPATDPQVLDDSTLTVTTPPGSVGPVDVTVEIEYAVSADTPNDQFTYQ